MSIKPKYPIFIPSKGRWETPLTAKMLLKDDVPFTMVVEPQEKEQYAAAMPGVPLLVLPQNNRGLVVARNFIQKHARESGLQRHWQLDDNMRTIYRLTGRSRIEAEAGPALRVVEDFTDRYANVGLSGLVYTMFCPNSTKYVPPFRLNCHIYSCMLIDHTLGFDWRGFYNEDVDYNLQVLAAGLCTLQVNVFNIHKLRTMTLKGGQGALYDGDGRLKMARALERQWPGVVTVSRRFGRPQHVVDWAKFKTPLILKEGIDLGSMEPDEYGMTLKEGIER